MSLAGTARSLRKANRTVFAWVSTTSATEVPAQQGFAWSVYIWHEQIVCAQRSHRLAVETLIRRFLKWAPFCRPTTLQASVFFSRRFCCDESAPQHDHGARRPLTVHESVERHSLVVRCRGSPSVNRAGLSHDGLQAFAVGLVLPRVQVSERTRQWPESP